MAIPSYTLQDFRRSHEARERAHSLIPSGAHTYSKGDDQFPALAPAQLVRGLGARTWDADGNEFVDWGMGLRSVILGHCDPGVLAAVRSALDMGSNLTRPSPIEAEVAELLVANIPSAEMVKFAKNGSDVTSAAVRLARAYTGRDLVARCAEHPFYSVHDWFIGDTVMNAGVPAATQALTKRFHYNDLASLAALFDAHPNQIAAVILEAVVADPPAVGFLDGVRRLCTAHGSLLIFDEVITGLRFHPRGAQSLFGVTPDLSTFSKALGNGFSVSALCGARAVMERGGLRHHHDRVFLLSNTFGGEIHHLAAAKEVLSRFFAGGVTERIWEMGGKLQQGLREAAASAGIDGTLRVSGYPCSPLVMLSGVDGQDSMPLRTLFLQEMARHGVLIPYAAPSAAHTERDLEQTLLAAAEACRVLRTALERGSTDGLLIGDVTKPVFRQRN